MKTSVNCYLPSHMSKQFLSGINTLHPFITSSQHSISDPLVLVHPQRTLNLIPNALVRPAMHDLVGATLRLGEGLLLGALLAVGDDTADTVLVPAY
jgi:hypothetical protein